MRISVWERKICQYWALEEVFHLFIAEVWEGSEEAHWLNEEMEEEAVKESGENWSFWKLVYAIQYMHAHHVSSWLL